MKEKYRKVKTGLIPYKKTADCQKTAALFIKKDYIYGNKKNWIVTGFEADDYTAEVKSIAGLWRMIKSA